MENSKKKEIKEYKRASRAESVRLFNNRCGSILSAFSPSDHIDDHKAFPNMNLSYIYDDMIDATTDKLGDMTLIIKEYGVTARDLEKFITDFVRVEFINYLNSLANNYDDTHLAGYDNYILDTIRDLEVDLKILKDAYKTYKR